MPLYALTLPGRNFLLWTIPWAIGFTIAGVLRDWLWLKLTRAQWCHSLKRTTDWGKGPEFADGQTLRGRQKTDKQNNDRWIRLDLACFEKSYHPPTLTSFRLAVTGFICESRLCLLEGGERGGGIAVELKLNRSVGHLISPRDLGAVAGAAAPGPSPSTSILPPTSFFSGPGSRTPS